MKVECLRNQNANTHTFRIAVFQLFQNCNLRKKKVNLIFCDEEKSCQQSIVVAEVATGAETTATLKMMQKKLDWVRQNE